MLVVNTLKIAAYCRAGNMLKNEGSRNQRDVYWELRLTYT